MFWRLTGSEYTASSKDRNRAMLHRLVEAGTVAPGLLAYRDGEPAGWISVGPVVTTDGWLDPVTLRRWMTGWSSR